MGILNMAVGTDHPNTVAVLTVLAAFSMSAGVRLLLGKVGTELLSVLRFRS